MIRSLFLGIALLFFSLPMNLLAQNPGIPQAVNYQGIVRDTQGNELVNTLFYFKVNILQNNTSVVFAEKHQKQTNEFGLFNLAIGFGNQISTDSFINIDWSIGNYYVQIEISSDDINYEDLGSSELLSVPYALFAAAGIGEQGPGGLSSLMKMEVFATSNNCPQGGIHYSYGLDANNDSILSASEIDTTLSVCNGVDVVEAYVGLNATNLDSLYIKLSNDSLINAGYVGRNDLDYDTTNERINNIALLGDTLLVIYEGNSHHSDSVLLTSLKITTDFDTDSTNEKIDSIYTNGNDLHIVENGLDYVVNINQTISEVDGDTTNELLNTVILGDSMIQFIQRNSQDTISIPLYGFANFISGTWSNGNGLSSDDGTLTIKIFDQINSGSIQTSVNISLAYIDTMYINANDLVVVQNLDTNKLNIHTFLSDSSASNELIDSIMFNTINSELIVYEGGISHTIALNGLLTEIDGDSTNEAISYFELLQDTLLVIKENGFPADTVNLALLNDPNSDDQILTLSGDTLYLENGGWVDLGDYADTIRLNFTTITQHITQDNDTSASNEIQFISISNDSIRLSNGGGAIALSALQDTLPIIMAADAETKIITTQTDSINFYTGSELKMSLDPEGRIGLSNTGGSVYLGEDVARNVDVSVNLNNTFIGYWSGRGTGFPQFPKENVGIGYKAMAEVTDISSTNVAQGNVALGFEALSSLQNGKYNIGIGYQTGNALTTGEHNILIGKESGSTLSTHSGNISIGYQAGKDAIGNDNAFFGKTAGKSAIGDYNASFGYYAGADITGNNNTGLGFSAGSNFLGNQNTAIGYKAGNAFKGDRNIFIGSNAGPLASPNINDQLYIDNIQSNEPLIYGDFQTDSLFVYGTLGIGHADSGIYIFPEGRGNPGQVLSLLNDSMLIWSSITSSIGRDSIIEDTDGDTRIYTKNNAVGTTGDSILIQVDNTLFWNFGQGRVDVLNTNGNVFIGEEAGSNSNFTNASHNIAFGTNALKNNTSGSYNIAIGNNVGDNLSGNSNTIIGNNAMAGNNNTGSGNVVLGEDVGRNSGSFSNMLLMDNTDTLSPLIHGDFSADSLTIHGILRIDSLSVIECPPGYSAINERVCIQTSTNAHPYWTAGNNCIVQQARLCRPTEWQTACATGLINPIVNTMEWVEAYGFGNAQSIKKTTVNCTNPSMGSPGNGIVVEYRCCFDR